MQYQHIAPNVLDEAALKYLEGHLKILSGFYGILSAFDGVVPYRLEMQAKLQTADADDLYGFWSGSIADNLYAETDCIVNLASKEYSVCISRYKKPGTRFITCVFGEEKGGKIIEKGTLCKMARGEMVRHLAECGAESPDALRSFSALGYAYAPEHSDAETYVFLLQKAATHGE